MKFSLVVAAAAASQVSIRNLYKLASHDGLAAGAVCTPAAEGAADPCGTGKTCSGAAAEGAASGTKTCKASLAQLDAGAVCTPAAEGAADPCGTGKTCTGA